MPWTAAGRATESGGDADEVVRDIGWVFNNETGQRLSLAEFVATGDVEVDSYLRELHLGTDDDSRHTAVEIGCGIGRMTAAFTRRFGRVVACDLDAAFLERCRGTVSQFGRPDALRTSHVADGRTLDVASGMADLTFSYITLQHCERQDALELAAEAVRVTRPGGQVALNFRTWTTRDALLYPAGVVTRALWRVPRLGAQFARWRVTARLGWQANRLAPAAVLDSLAERGVRLAEVRIVQSPRRRPVRLEGVESHTFEGVNPSHWWLVARVV